MQSANPEHKQTEMITKKKETEKTMSTMSPHDKEAVRMMILEALKRELEDYDFDAMPDVEEAMKPKIAELTSSIEDKFLDARTKLEAIVSEGLAVAGEQVKSSAETLKEANTVFYDSIRAMIEKLPDEEKATVKRKVSRSVDAKVAIGASPYHNFLARRGSPGNAYKPILVIGGQGSGKTTGALQFAYSAGFDEVVIMDGHSGVEAMDMVGGLRPHEGGVAWQDGKISQAFRAAQGGKRVCLVIDEYYRIRRMERSPLISALSPYVYPDGPKYRLSTGRVIGVKDGVVVGEEVLFAPVENITIIATTNAGSSFDVESGDPAEASRWIQYDVESTEDNAKYILNQVVKGVGWDEKPAKEVVNRLLQVLRTGKDARNKNFLVLSPDVRILSDAIKMSETPSQVKESLLEVAIVWVGRNLDGVRSEEQMKQFRALIDTAFA